MKLALHRSITFWLGLLVMAFVCWSWRDSYYYGSGFKYEHLAGVNMVGGIMLERVEEPGRRIFRIRSSPFVRSEAAPTLFFLRGARGAGPAGVDPPEPPERPTIREFSAYRAARWIPPDCGALFVPHWLILLAAFVPWLGLLAWRARRRKRKIGA